MRQDLQNDFLDRQYTNRVLLGFPEERERFAQPIISPLAFASWVSLNAFFNCSLAIIIDFDFGLFGFFAGAAAGVVVVVVVSLIFHSPLLVC